MNRSQWGILAAVLVAGSLIACSSKSDSPASSSTPSARGETAHSNAVAVNVTLKEFSVSATPSAVPAGEVAFKATNAGTVAHEMVVLKTDKDVKSLPTKSDGTVDEAAANSVGEVNDLDAGKSGSATFRLTAGKYVLVCNLPGHYAAGMATAFTVN